MRVSFIRVRLEEACRRAVSKMRKRVNGQKTERSKVSKWGLSLTGLLETPDFVV